MKKVVFFTYGMKFGGVEKVIATLANFLTKSNIECYIITLINDQCAYKLEKKVKLIPLFNKNGTPSGMNLLSCLFSLRKYIKEIKPDMIVSMPEEISGKALAALIGINVPIIVSERNNPWIMPKNKANRLLRKVLYPLAKGFVFQTEQASQFFTKKIREKGIIIPNPIDLSRIPDERILVRRNEIVTVGRLEAQKNHKLLIRAYALFQESHPDFKLIFYGDGSERKELEEYARLHLHENSYEFRGTRKDVLHAIQEASLFVLSSDYEGMPNALMEAMAIGLPVISTDCPSGGPSALIKNESNGLLVPVNDTHELAKAMTKITEDKVLASKLSKNALLIRNQYNPDVILEKWRKYLYEIWNKNTKAKY